MKTSNELLTEVERLSSQARAGNDPSKGRQAIAMCEAIIAAQKGDARLTTMALQLRLMFQWAPRHPSVDQAFRRLANEVEAAPYATDLERKVARRRISAVLKSTVDALTPAMQQWQDTADYRVTPADLGAR